MSTIPYEAPPSSTPPRAPLLWFSLELALLLQPVAPPTSLRLAAAVHHPRTAPTRVFSLRRRPSRDPGRRMKIERLRSIAPYELNPVPRRHPVSCHMYCTQAPHKQTCPVSSHPCKRLSPRFKKKQKSLQTLEMHRNCLIAWKIMNPIFIALWCATLYRKNAKVDKKDKYAPRKIIYVQTVFI